jgi:hypothetical protein
MTESIRLRIIQSGQEVAAVDGPPEPAIRDAMHYAMVYAQDSEPTTIEGLDEASKAALERAFGSRTP